MEELETAIIKYLCPICGKVAEEGIIMNSLLTKEAASQISELHNKAVGYADHACKECIKYKGLYIIGIDVSKSEEDNPWRTGHIVCVKDTSDLAKHLKDYTITLKDGSKYCFMDYKIGKNIKLWE